MTPSGLLLLIFSPALAASQGNIPPHRVIALQSTNTNTYSSRFVKPATDLGEEFESGQLRKFLFVTVTSYCYL